MGISCIYKYNTWGSFLVGEQHPMLAIIQLCGLIRSLAQDIGASPLLVSSAYHSGHSNSLSINMPSNFMLGVQHVSRFGLPSSAQPRCQPVTMAWPLRA